MEEIYGILGYPLGHSFSQKYFNEKFESDHIENASFLKFEIEDATAIPQIFSIEGLKGFCITIPHKKNIISFLDDVSPEVSKMGACNCVKISNGKLIGYNTDIIGFEKSFTPQLQSYHDKALILGTGGAAAAVAYILEKLGISFQYVSRAAQDTLHYEDLNEAIMSQYTVIINSTPLGTYPNVDSCPDIPYELLTDRHYLYDLVYNPAETKFLKLGKEKGAAIKNGHDMLMLQAEENWRIWND